jgi:hypothetical protein
VRPAAQPKLNRRHKFFLDKSFDLKPNAKPL